MNRALLSFEQQKTYILNNYLVDSLAITKSQDNKLVETEF